MIVANPTHALHCRVSLRAEELAKTLRALIKPGAFAQELGGANCCVLLQEGALGSISTICLRGSTEVSELLEGMLSVGHCCHHATPTHVPYGTQGQLDDVERAINNAVNAFKALTRDARCLAAGGAVEMEVARQLQVRWTGCQSA
eukprot:1157552-Pelagomonas_calceolata.AAC.4